MPDKSLEHGAKATGPSDLMYLRKDKTLLADEMDHFAESANERGTISGSWKTFRELK